MTGKLQSSVPIHVVRMKAFSCTKHHISCRRVDMTKFVISPGAQQASVLLILRLVPQEPIMVFRMEEIHGKNWG